MIYYVALPRGGHIKCCIKSVRLSVRPSCLRFSRNRKAI